MTVPETLENLISASPLIIEGKVRSQTGFYDVENKNIYTVNEIEVFKIFQGIPTIGTVHVVTKGGVVAGEGDTDFEMDRVSNALELKIGEMGLFMLQAFSGNLPTAEILHRPTEGVLGFIRYDLIVGTAQGAYMSYSDVPTELYNLMTDLTGLSILNVGLWDTEDAGLSGEPSIESSIVSENEGSSNSNFEVHAGVGDLLTISGVDFGPESGSVLFPDANSGGSGYISTLPHQIREWSDERIVLEVPYRAGTGKVRIDKANGESLIGEDDLPIGYDHINVQYTDDMVRKAYHTQLTSDNGKGGYDFQFESDFAENTGASQAFINLIETWACTTGVNFQVGEVTNVDEDANDGINIVRFDNGDELGGRTLAYARSRYRGCYQGETIKWFVNEIEVVVNDDYDWYYGDGLPGASQFDFETVMLHEIGHTTQLGHVINANEVMHFAVGPGQQKRSLSFIDTIGGEFVTDKSINEAVCGRNLMEPYGVCCETMAITEHPSDQILCNDRTSANFNFEVEFSDTWQWQVKNGGVWTDLVDDNSYSGTLTSTLTVIPSEPKMKEFRCLAGNACDASVFSETASFSVRELDFSMSSLAATCDTEGLINLDRKITDGAFRVSINGGASFETVWPANKSQIDIFVPAGSYSIVVADENTVCTKDLGTVVIDGPFELELSAEAIQPTVCPDETGSIRVSFNDHPDYRSVQISLDSGATFESFDDSLGSVLIENIEIGDYTIVGRWEGESCQIGANPVSLKPVLLPEAMVKGFNADCAGDNAAFLISFNTHPDFDQVELSLDGGITYPYTLDTTSQQNNIDGLASGSYALWARWLGSSCGHPLGSFTLQSESPENGVCSTAEGEDTDTTPIPEDRGDSESADSPNSDEVALKLYPNPTFGRIFIESYAAEILRLRLFDVKGALIQDIKPQRDTGNTYFMDIDYPQAGVYALHIITERKNIIRRVILK